MVDCAWTEWTTVVLQMSISIDVYQVLYYIILNLKDIS